MLSVTQLLITLITTAYCARIREVTVTREVFYSKEVYTSRIVEPTRSDLIEPSFSRPLLTISVRESLLSMAKAGRSTAIRLIRLIDGRDEPDKTTSLFYAKFTAAYTNCTLDSEVRLFKHDDKKRGAPLKCLALETRIERLLRISNQHINVIGEKQILQKFQKIHLFVS
ncbi:hypothetical protein D918_09338 [Trichuris suis]|nr:hypothetical protein D918_09338 [Trichuris suis]